MMPFDSHMFGNSGSLPAIPSPCLPWGGGSGRKEEEGTLLCNAWSLYTSCHVTCVVVGKGRNSGEALPPHLFPTPSVADSLEMQMPPAPGQVEAYRCHTTTSPFHSALQEEVPGHCTFSVLTTILVDGGWRGRRCWKGDFPTSLFLPAFTVISSLFTFCPTIHYRRKFLQCITTTSDAPFDSCPFRYACHTHFVHDPPACLQENLECACLEENAVHCSMFTTYIILHHSVPVLLIGKVVRQVVVGGIKFYYIMQEDGRNAV